MKRALIFTSSVGGGHDSVAGAVSDLLQFNSRYSCVRIDIYDLIGSIKSINRWFPFSISTVYNEVVLKRGYTGVLWIILAATLRLVLLLFKRKISDEVAKCIREKQADIVVSVLPMVNEIIGIAAKNSNYVPFMTVVVDLDEVYRGMWVQHLQQRVVCFSDTIYDATLRFGIPSNHICKLTAPIVPLGSLRSMTECERVSCRLKYGLHPDSLAILVSFGAEGADKMVGYVSALIDSTCAFLICLCGRNNRVCEKVRTIVPQSRGIVFGFTDKYLELFNIADMLVTKPGSLTVWQSVLLSRPMLLEMNWKTLIHERKTGLWAVKNGLGFAFSNRRSLVRMVRRLERLNDLSGSKIEGRFGVFSPINEDELAQRLFHLVDDGEQDIAPLSGKGLACKGIS